MDVWQDGVVYAEMGRSFARFGEFFLPDGERMGRQGSRLPGYSHHFPPAFPFALGLGFSCLGFGAAPAKLVLTTLSLAALVAVYGTTRNLFGAERAWLVTGLVALEPGLVWVTGIGLSENFSLLFATLTLWAFVRSLGDIRFLLPSGVFWTIVYLTRSSAGVFGLLPAAAGVLWWARFRDWRALLSPWCLGAGAVFGAVAALWSWRNYQLFGDPATSPYMSTAIAYGLSQPALFARALAGKAAFFGTLLLAYALPFAPELRASLRRLREAETSLLWLFVAAIFGLAWCVTAAFWPYEQRPFLDLTHQRYIVMGIVPLLWLALGGAPAPGLRWRWLALALALGAASTAVLLHPIRRSGARAAEFVAPYLRDGDTVMIAGSVRKYDLDLHLDRIDHITVRTRPGPSAPAFAFFGDQLPDPLPEGWELIGIFEEHGPVESVTYVIADRDVVRERALATLELPRDESPLEEEAR
jgi:hypothetical protein